MLDPHYSVRPQNGRHPFGQKNGETKIRTHHRCAKRAARDRCTHGCEGPQKGLLSYNKYRPRFAYANSFGAVRRFLRRAPAQKTELQSSSVWSGQIGPGKLLDFDLGAGLFALLLYGGRFLFVNAFLDGLRSAINQVFGFFQAQAGDFANRFDDVYLVATTFGGHAAEFLLLSPPRP